MTLGRRRLDQVLGFLGFGFVAVLLLLLGYRLAPPSAPEVARGRPAAMQGLGPDPSSLLLITIDGLSASRLVNGGTEPQLPTNLDRLAQDAFRFEQVVTPSPSPLVAHASLLTGLSPAASGVRSALAGPLQVDRATLAQILRPEQFHTAGFIGSGALGRFSGLARGFERFDEPRSGDRPAVLRFLVDRPNREVIDAARVWLDENFRSRFFLWVQLSIPRDRPGPAPRAGGTNGDRHADAVARVDAEVGRLLGRLSSLGAFGKTIVMLTSSHGAGRNDRSGPGAVIQLYDEMILVPALLRLPGAGARGRSIPEQVRLIDLLPTVLELLRVRPPGTLDGGSLVPLLEPEGNLRPQPALSDSVLIDSVLGGPRQRSVRLRDWKYIQAGEEELYDLRRDPRERSNLARSQSTKLAELRGILHGITGEVPVDLPSRIAASTHTVALFESAIEALRSGDGVRATRALEELPSVEGGADLPVVLEALRGAARVLREEPAKALPYYERALGGLEQAGAIRSGATGLRGLLQADIASCRRLLGDDEGALESYRQAEGMLPDDPEVRLAIGSLLLEMGRADEAVDALSAALARAPEIAIAHFQLARAYDSLDRPLDASRAYQDYLACAGEGEVETRKEATERLGALSGPP